MSQAVIEDLTINEFYRLLKIVQGVLRLFSVRLQKVAAYRLTGVDKFLDFNLSQIGVLFILLTLEIEFLSFTKISSPMIAMVLASATTIPILQSSSISYNLGSDGLPIITWSSTK